MKLNKSHIRQVLRTCDRTLIFRLFFKYYGYIDRNTIYDFIIKFSPNKRVRSLAYYIAFESPHRYIENCYKGPHGYFSPLPLSHVINYVKSMLKRKFDNYSKIPVLGKTHLYFAHPIFLHSDYNKVRLIEIKGNEKLIQIIFSLFNKYSNYEKN